MFRVYFMSETAQVEPKSGRVQAPVHGAHRADAVGPPRERVDDHAGGRGLHSSTFRLNLSAFCRIGVHSGIVWEVSRGY